MSDEADDLARHAADLARAARVLSEMHEAHLELMWATETDRPLPSELLGYVPHAAPWSELAELPECDRWTPDLVAETADFAAAIPDMQLRDALLVAAAQPGYGVRIYGSEIRELMRVLESDGSEREALLEDLARREHAWLENRIAEQKRRIAELEAELTEMKRREEGR